ncbi:hypothetical protein AK830_g67 [Neonectria ditissima]|uniref:Xylanolytic transcriptional activator regulatory domain-containing protein n=1 Tax=Neonectria ditissima TaxID=78410 RepID=A0A0P7BMJ2_9HYPO|nr:hypothetical protein AK830_g67 [Neonectria ditissima]
MALFFISKPSSTLPRQLRDLSITRTAPLSVSAADPGLAFVFEMADESHDTSPDASDSRNTEPTTAARPRKRSYIADAEGPEANRDDSIHVCADEPPSMEQESRAASQAAPAVDTEPEPQPELDPELETRPDLSNAEADTSRVDPHIRNPIHQPERLFALDQASQEQFVGESTCLAFGDRILQCLNPQATTTSPPVDNQYVRDPLFARQLRSVAGCKFPERIRANLLVRVALRFIGQDYHLFLHHDFLAKFDKAYASRQSTEFDSVWVCKFFVILALGEMYSTSLPAAKEGRSSSSVPGTGYFLTAVGLLQDLFEEPSIAQIETLLLFCFYSNVLGRVKSAHMYSGMAVRSSTCLGLHRSIPASSILSPIEREHRIRLWWTVYIFDRSTCSKLGQPLTIQDADIDVSMPSSDVMIPESHTRLASPDHLMAYINLAQITGFIMRDIYAPASKSSGGRLVQNVRSILQELRKWDAHVPARLRWNPEGGVPRPVASLQLHFNQCIILTTRPILLHIFKIRNPFVNHAPANPTSGVTDAPHLSDTTKSLADACVAAARTSNMILSQLFVDNALATCGYFDAHHLFASTLVLIISAISSPNSSDSDAVQTAFQLLMVMRDNGNAAAGAYFSRLLQIQWTVSRLFTQATTTAEETTTPALDAPSGAAEDVTAPNPPSGLAELDDYDWTEKKTRFSTRRM